MADGVVVYDTGAQALIFLLDAANGITDGVWYDTGGYMMGMVHSALGGSTVELCGTNAMVKPSSVNHGTPLATAGAVNGFLSIPVLPRFLKARCTTFVTPCSVSILVRR